MNLRILVSMAAGLGITSGIATLAPTVATSLGSAYEKGRTDAIRERLSTAPRSAFTPRSAFESRVRDVARIIRPSVVQVMTMRVVETRGDIFGFSAPQRAMRQQGVGSGVIVSSDGYILTNNHVVRSANRVDVQLADGRRLVARVVGTDPATDLAVLDLDAENLTPARLGKSDKLEVGDWVLAAGSPFGLDQSVSAGIISAFGRSRVGVASYEDFIQTDAAVNPGNSGGPLVNMRGEVIGINTAIASRTGAYNGISFAIPSGLAEHVLEQIIDKGHVDRGWLGFYVRDDKSQRGVLVADVVPNGPAAAAGIQPGDVVTAVDGTKVETSKQLIFLVADLAAAKKASIEVLRDGHRVALEATIGKRPPQPRRR